MAVSQIQHEYEEKTGKSYASLSEFVEVSEYELELYFDTWSVWRMTGKKYPIQYFLGEEVKPRTTLELEHVWVVIMEIDANYEDYLQVLREQHG